MKKTITLSVLAFSILGIIGCADTESIPSDDLYTRIAEKKMPYYCKQKVMEELGIDLENIYVYPIVFERGAKVIRGRYSVDKYNLKEFACIFNNNDSYAGISLRHTKIKNTVCTEQ